jgi:DNA mismatch endonuclease, patch repair protein
VDRLTPERRSENMRRIRSRDMRPELLIRSAIHRLGFRFRLHGKGLPGKPDLVFAGRRKVIFVHGCFWHQHAGCREASRPKSNRAYWGAKLRGNVLRDRRHLRDLETLGWRSLVVWECEIEKTLAAVLRRVGKFLTDTHPARGSPRTPSRPRESRAARRRR